MCPALPCWCETNKSFCSKIIGHPGNGVFQKVWACTCLGYTSAAFQRAEVMLLSASMPIIKYLSTRWIRFETIGSVSGHRHERNWISTSAEAVSVPGRWRKPCGIFCFSGHASHLPCLKPLQLQILTFLPSLWVYRVLRVLPAVLQYHAFNTISRLDTYCTESASI